MPLSLELPDVEVLRAAGLGSIGSVPVLKPDFEAPQFLVDTVPSLAHFLPLERHAQVARRGAPIRASIVPETTASLILVCSFQTFTFSKC